MNAQGHVSLRQHHAAHSELADFRQTSSVQAQERTHFCTSAIVDFSLGFETWKMLFSPKLKTGTRDAPVFTAILTKPCAKPFYLLRTYRERLTLSDATPPVPLQDLCGNVFTPQLFAKGWSH